MELTIYEVLNAVADEVSIAVGPDCSDKERLRPSGAELGKSVSNIPPYSAGSLPHSPSQRPPVQLKQTTH